MNNKNKPLVEFTNRAKPNNGYTSIASFLIHDTGYITINDDGDKIVINLGGLEKPYNSYINKLK